MELLQVGLVASGVLVWFLTVKADTQQLSKDVARHEHMLEAITQTESTLASSQTKIAATLDGVREILDMHVNNGSTTHRDARPLLGEPKPN